jgi:hypothetical protein
VIGTFLNFGRCLLVPWLGAALAITLVLSGPAAAHQRQLLQIEGADYLVVVGFLNEPVFVGDKTGVDLIVMTPDPSDPTDSFAPRAKPVDGLDKSLKVEVKAGPHARIFDLYPAFRAPGRYQAVFYPTVPTTYSFRLFGTVNRVPVDLTFTCNPAGHVAFEDRTVAKLSNHVTRKVAIGSFGCPDRRDEVEFPPPRRQP